MFRIHDAENCLYKQIRDPSELRLQISQVMRDIRKSINKEKSQANAATAKKNQETPQPEEARSSAIEYNDFNDYSNQDLAFMTGLDPRRLKRVKTDDNNNNNFGGFCNDRSCL